MGGSSGPSGFQLIANFAAAQKIPDPKPGLPDDEIPTQKTGPDGKKYDLTPDAIQKFETEREELKSRYDQEGSQEESLYSSLQNRRRTPSGTAGGTILTGPVAPPPMGTTTGAGGSGKTLLGQ